MVLGSESNLIILLMIGLVVLLIYHRQTKSKNTCENSREDFHNLEERKRKSKRRQKTKHISDDVDDVDINNLNMDDDDIDNVNVDDLVNSMTGSRRSRNIRDMGRPQLNVEFAEMQYHKDYNDTITAINNLTSQKELFNLGFLPVIESKPHKANVKSLAKLFIKKLNNEVVNNVQEYLHTNSGWNDMGKRRREKSGFEEQMEELGLPGSLYTEPADKARVKIVKIDKAEQFTTDDQIRFTIYMIVQKENVKDQMVLQVQFFMEREDLSGDRDDRANFFEKGLTKEGDNEKVGDDQLTIIEQVFILGYLTNSSSKKTRMDKFHDYDNVQRADGTIDQEKVINTMLQKHKEREQELNSFVSTLDDETREIHDVPDVGPYSHYKNTRTIMDDLAQFPQRSFGDVPI